MQVIRSRPARAYRQTVKTQASLQKIGQVAGVAASSFFLAVAVNAATISPPEIGKVHMDTVKHIFQSFEQGKIETIPLSFSPKAECIYPATSSLPWSGTWSGADCLLQFIDKFDKFESVNLKSETYFTNEEGDVAVFVEEDNKNKATGKPIKMTCAMGFKFDDQGKITRFEDICNTLLEASALPPQ